MIQNKIHPKAENPRSGVVPPNAEQTTHNGVQHLGYQSCGATMGELPLYERVKYRK